MIATQADLVRSCAGPRVDVRFIDDPATLRSAISTVEAFVGPSLSTELCAIARRLRLVQSSITGIDGFDRRSLPEGTRFAVVGSHERSVAEHVVMTILALYRRLLSADAGLRRGEWDSTFQLGPLFTPFSTLRGKRICLYGYGGIGLEVSRLLEPFGVAMTAVRSHPGSTDESTLEDVGGPDRLAELASLADVLVVAVPLTPTTVGSIDSHVLDGMRADAVIINVARGPVIVEEALYEALLHRSIAGAALDVWYRYPDGHDSALPSTLPFWELDNVLMTPHNSGMTAETFLERSRTIGDNLRRFATGEALAFELV